MSLGLDFFGPTFLHKKCWHYRPTFLFLFLGGGGGVSEPYDSWEVSVLLYRVYILEVIYIYMIYLYNEVVGIPCCDVF